MTEEQFKIFMSKLNQIETRILKIEETMARNTITINEQYNNGLTTEHFNYLCERIRGAALAR